MSGQFEFVRIMPAGETSFAHRIGLKTCNLQDYSARQEKSYEIIPSGIMRFWFCA